MSISKSGFQNYFYKASSLFIKHLNRFTTLILIKSFLIEKNNILNSRLTKISKHYQNDTKTHNKLSIWVPTTYTTLTMLFVHSQLLLSSNSKKISLVKTIIWAQNYILHVKTSLGVCSLFKIEPWNHKNKNGMQNGATMRTSEIASFNHSLFGNYETAIGFVVSKQVQEGSQIHILNPSWPYT